MLREWRHCTERAKLFPQPSHSVLSCCMQFRRCGFTAERPLDLRCMPFCLVWAPLLTAPCTYNHEYQPIQVVPTLRFGSVLAAAAGGGTRRGRARIGCR